MARGLEGPVAAIVIADKRIIGRCGRLGRQLDLGQARLDPLFEPGEVTCFYRASTGIEQVRLGRHFTRANLPEDQAVFRPGSQVLKFAFLFCEIFVAGTKVFQQCLRVGSCPPGLLLSNDRQHTFQLVVVVGQQHDFWIGEDAAVDSHLID